jgi:hypothetical protein
MASGFNRCFADVCHACLAGTAAARADHCREPTGNIEIYYEYPACQECLLLMELVSALKKPGMAFSTD